MASCGPTADQLMRVRSFMPVSSSVSRFWFAFCTAQRQWGRAYARRREPHRHMQQCVARRGGRRAAVLMVGAPHPQLDDRQPSWARRELAILVPLHLEALTARAWLLAQSVRAERGAGITARHEQGGRRTHSHW